MSVTKVCAVRPTGKNKGVKRLIEHGAIYGGKFSPVWGADKNGRSAVLVLRDEGDRVLVAPVAAAPKAKRGALRIRMPKGQPLSFSGVIELDEACAIDKKLLDRKLGDLPTELMGAVAVAAYSAERRAR
jgi:mRNA-degrading endonuclease toxin of MazEF toxin-antitoxin module